MLVDGQYADGRLTANPAGRPHGWIEVKDQCGNAHGVWVSTAELPGQAARGQLLNSRLGVSVRGAKAADVGASDQQRAA